MEFIAAEISRGTGLGGKSRREKSTSKRVYDAVDKAIQRAIKDLGTHCPEFGQHLKDNIGYKRADGWRYQPPDKIDWRF